MPLCLEFPTHGKDVEAYNPEEHAVSQLNQLLKLLQNDNLAYIYMLWSIFSIRIMIDNDSEDLCTNVGQIAGTTHTSTLWNIFAG